MSMQAVELLALRLLERFGHKGFAIRDEIQCPAVGPPAAGFFIGP
jgi:hypothetical protein